MRRLIFSLFVALSGLLAAPVHAENRQAAVIDEILARGEATVASYDEKNTLATTSEFSAIYFERFEALELDLKLLDSRLMSELEVLFGALNTSAMRGVPRAQLESIWQQLAVGLGSAKALFAEGSNQSDASLGALLKSILILLREGAEAMLVVAALATWLRRAGAADRIWTIYTGVVVAVVASFITGFAIDRLLKGMATPLPIVEGVTMLFASAMLFSVSCWLFAKRSAKRWEEWIGGQMESAVSRGSLLALASTAFLAVYREGAETVLFYQALAASAPGQGAAILAGFLVAVLILAALYYILRHAALRLPFGLFFGVTSALLYLMSIIFFGQGIVKLQAAGWTSFIYLPDVPQVDWLGIAPFAQSLGIQALLLILPCLWFVWQRRQAQLSPSTPR